MGDKIATTVVLRACPFCGARGDELRLMELDDSQGVSVVCDCCGAIGPTDVRPDAAAAMWNGAPAHALGLAAA